MPEGVSRSVCDLRPVSYLRMMFGYYADLGLPQWKQRLLQMYCAVAPVVWIILNYRNSVYDINSFNHDVYCIACYAVTIFTQNRYIYEYYKVIPIIDNVPRSEKIYSKLEKIVWFLCLILFAAVTVIHVKVNYQQPGVGFMVLLIKFFRMSQIMLGRLSNLLMFLLLSIRVKSFRMMVTSEERPTPATGANSHVLAYIALHDSLEKTGVCPMFLLCTEIGTWFLNMLWMAFDATRFIKSEIHTVNYLDLSLVCVILILDTLILFFPSVMLELVADELEQSRVFVADRLITCVDDTKRSELKQLDHFLRHLPLQYKACHVVPVNALLPVGLLTLGVDIFVFGLQFTRTPNASYHVNMTGI